MAQFQFVMRSGPTPGVIFPLEGDQLTIGRDANNGVAINDAEVSRKHSRLTFQGGKYVLEDLGSTNGTFVNGQRLAGPRVLKAGEVVSFGEQIVMVFEAASPAFQVSVPLRLPEKSLEDAAPPLADQLTETALFRSPLRATWNVNAVAPELPSALSAESAPSASRKDPHTVGTLTSSAGGRS